MWEQFEETAIQVNKTAATGVTKSFRDIELKTVYNIKNPRLVQTQYGPRVIVTVAEVISKKKEGQEEDRWCFPRLFDLFVEETAPKKYKLKEKNVPFQIGFTSRYPQNYDFFCKFK